MMKDKKVQPIAWSLHISHPKSTPNVNLQCAPKGLGVPGALSSSRVHSKNHITALVTLYVNPT